MLAEQEEIRGVAFDARQRFYQELMDAHSMLRKCRMVGDLFGWYCQLHEMYNMVAPWIGKDERAMLEFGDKKDFWGLWLVQKKIETAAGFQHVTDPLRQSAARKLERDVQNQLIMIHGRMFQAARHMMLPEKEVLDDDPSKAIFR